MKGRTTISYPLSIAVLTLPMLSYRVSLSKHTNFQTPNILTKAVRGLLRGRDDVRRAVKPSMSWLQATVALVTYIVELPLPILRTAVVVILGDSNICGNTLTSRTLTTTMLLTVSAAGLVRNEGLAYDTVLHARISRHDCVSLPNYCLYLGTGDVVSVQYRTLL